VCFKTKASFDRFQLIFVILNDRNINNLVVIHVIWFRAIILIVMELIKYL